MGLLSKLGKLAEIAGLVAAPFTGGASTAVTAGAKAANMASKAGKIATAASAIGKVAGNTSTARAGARVQEAALNADQDRLALDRAAQAQRARATDESSAVRGGLLEGVRDAEITRPEGVTDHITSGGLRPSAIAGGAAMGKQFKDDALARIIADNSTPQLTKNPSAGKLDKFLNFASGVGGLVGLGGELKGALGGGPAIPDVMANTKVSTDPSILATTPSVDAGIDTSKLPTQSRYNRPRFTPRF